MATYGPTFHRTNSETFTAQVQDIVTNTEAKLLAVFRESFQRTVDIAQTPQGKGGRMRVDTGFLRASGAASLSGMPAGPSRNESGAPVASPERFREDASVAVAIANLSIGETIYFGWTADYARYREYQDGFLRLATQRWQATVDEVVKEANARSASAKAGWETRRG